MKNNSTITGEVLIVEDTPESLQLLTQLMSSAGYQVRQAQDGEMALLSVQAQAPDLILLDIRMPGMNGFEVCRYLKSAPNTANIPIIFLSALQDTDAKVQGFKLGAVDFIGKPYHEEEVLARVRAHMELRHLQANLEQQVLKRTQELREEVEVRRRAEDELRESQRQLRELSGHLEDIREAERARIAREIHDELGQSLTALRIDLTQLSTHLDEPKEKLENKLNSIISLLDNTADLARRISENLRPGMLDLLGLGAAIEYHVTRFSDATGIQCELTMEREITIQDKEATALFRIVQEALTNVARHANASSVTIRLVELHNELLLIVQDNGCGMPATEELKGKRSYGLLGMRERVTMLGGSLDIESEPGKGTRIEVSIPLKNADVKEIASS